MAETTAELNLRTNARLAGIRQAQASRLLPDLVSLGVVERREVPPSSLFQLVRPTGVDEDDANWPESLDAWCNDLERLTGNRVEVLGVSVDEIGTKPRGNGQLWRDIRRDGHVMCGPTISQLTGAPVG